MVSFTDIVKTYEIYKNSNTSRALTKLTISHIRPGPFKKFTVNQLSKYLAIL